MFPLRLTDNADQKPESEVSVSRDIISESHIANVSPSAPREPGAVLPKPMVLSAAPRPAHRERERAFRPKIPVITGDVTYRGTLGVEGLISGQLGADGGLLSVKQRARNVGVGCEPELNGELSFQDLLRVNGHIAGTLYSKSGTLYIDEAALVEADIDVAVAIISGTVHGDVIAHQRLELGANARIKGNILTRSLAIKPGAAFEGECKILRDQETNGAACASIQAAVGNVRG